MGLCGTCRHKPRQVAEPPLAQIRRTYLAQYGRLRFSVEADSGEWILHVQNAADGNPLYTAHRSSVRAAQFAAADFAAFQISDGEVRIGLDRLARELNWQERW